MCVILAEYFIYLIMCVILLPEYFKCFFNVCGIISLQILLHFVNFNWQLKKKRENVDYTKYKKTKLFTINTKLISIDIQIVSCSENPSIIIKNAIFLYIEWSIIYKHRYTITDFKISKGKLDSVCCWSSRDTVVIYCTLEIMFPVSMIRYWTYN